jgi:hypothetical protein
MIKEWKPTHTITTPSGVHELEIVFKLGDDSWGRRRYDVLGYSWYDPRDLKPIASEPPSVSEETKSTTAPKTVYKCPNCGERNPIELSFVGDLKS